MTNVSVLGKDTEFQEKIVSSTKNQERSPEWHQSLELARYQELRIMRENFVNPEYLRARKDSCTKSALLAPPPTYWKPRPPSNARGHDGIYQKRNQ